MFATEIPAVGRSAVVIACTAWLAGCAGPTVEPTQAGLNRAVGDARTALSEAQDAYRTAEKFAARRAWPAAARAVDDVMFALQDARRLRKSVAAADERAQLAHREAVAQRDQIENKLQLTRRALGTLSQGVPPVRYASSAVVGGECGVACEGSPQAHAAAEAVILSAATVTRTREAVARVDAQVSQIETIARKVRKVGQTPPKSTIKPPDLTPTPAEDLHRLTVPDTSFDQDVFGAQQ